MADSTSNTNSNANFEFVQKFSYREYKGRRTSRLGRIFSLAIFEVKNTWNKSTIGKIVLGLVVFFSVFTILSSVNTMKLMVQANQSVTNTSDFIHQQILYFVAGYFAFFTNIIFPSTNVNYFLSSTVGLFVIGLLAIAGSGFFADDKQGKVIEIYLSRMKREDYALGKILGMFLYCNLFITVPVLILALWTVQGLGQNQLDYLTLYIAIGFAGAVISMMFTIIILLLSSLVDKRAYASLAFFIGYILLDILSLGFYTSNYTNEFYLLLIPSSLIALFIYSIGENFNLGIINFNFQPDSNNAIIPLLLNNGTGLEWYHVVGTVFGILIIGILLLLFKIHRITTNEL